MKWKVYLTGDVYDLNELSRAMKSSELSVDKDHDGFFLRSTELDSLDSYEEVNRNAKGSLQSLLQTRQPIEIDHLIRINDDGSPTRISFGDGHVLMHLRAHAELELHAVNGSVSRGASSDPTADWVTLTHTEKNVAEVFRLIAVDADSWSGLYKIVEAISKDAGDIVKKGWLSRNSHRRFRHTANSPSSVGLAARHGAKDTQPPPKPMPLTEARVLVQGIVHNWMREKLEQRHTGKAESL